MGEKLLVYSSKMMNMSAILDGSISKVFSVFALRNVRYRSDSVSIRFTVHARIVHNAF